MKRYAYLVLFIVLASLLVVGCTESNSEEKNNESIESPSQTLETSSQAIEEPSNDQDGYQDSDWLAYLQIHMAIISLDLEGLSSAQGDTPGSFDTKIMIEYGQNLVNDTQTAIEENDKYTVSPELQETQKYWRMSLQNYNSAGQFTVIGAEAFEKGDETEAKTNFEKAATFINMGNIKAKLASDSLSAE